MRHEMVAVRRCVRHTYALHGANQMLVTVGEGVDQYRQPPAACFDDASRQLQTGSTPMSCPINVVAGYRQRRVGQTRWQHRTLALQRACFMRAAGVPGLG